jgi:hypothetical protein
MGTINLESVSTRPRVSFGFAYSTHLVVLMLAFLAGFCVEAVIDKAYYNTRLEAFAPAVCVVTFIVGLWVNRRWRTRAACYVWIVALVWFGLGFLELYRGWDPSWAHKTRRQYVVDDLFGKTVDCSGSECMYELLFTAPLMASLAYSLGALVGLRSSPRRGPFTTRN